MQWPNITSQKAWMFSIITVLNSNHERSPTHRRTDVRLLNYLLTYLLTYPMQQSPSWETNWFAASQEIPHILWNPNVHYRIHKCPANLSLSRASLIQSILPHTTSWRSILILSSHLCLAVPSGLYPSGFPTKTLYTPLLSPICITCPAHLIFLDFITRTILGEEYRTLSSSLCSFLHFPVTSSVLGPSTDITLFLFN